MPVSKLSQRRQVVIPKEICEALGLQTGDVLEVHKVKGTVVITPKKLVDADDVLTPEEEAIVRQGEAQLRRGEYVTLEDIEHDVDRTSLKRRRETTSTAPTGAAHLLLAPFPFGQKVVARVRE